VASVEPSPLKGRTTLIFLGGKITLDFGNEKLLIN